jgi:hypothetical protein
MDFFNHREEGMVFYQVFLLSSLLCTITLLVEIRKRLCEFEEIFKCEFEEICKRLREFEAPTGTSYKIFLPSLVCSSSRR